MRLSPLLLRCLLIVALVSNAMGSAFAITQTQVDHLRAQLVMAQREPVAKRAAMPCHEHSGMTANASTTELNHGAPLAKTQHPSPDCCQSAKCQCACMQYVAIAAVSIPMLEANVYRAISIGALNTGHDAPALPHLIRPPID